MNEAPEDVEDSILYELLVYSEWSSEQDVIVSYSRVKQIGVLTDFSLLLFQTKRVGKSWAWKNVTGFLKTSPGSCYISE